MTYTVATWGSDVRNAETKFCGIVADCLEQLNNGNSTDLAKLLCITHGKKSGIISVIEGEKLQYAAPLKRVLAKALEGVEYRFDPKKKSGVKFKLSDNGGANTDVIQALRVLGSARVQSKAFRDTFPTVKVEKEFDVKAWAERVIKSNGADQLEAMIAALQAQRTPVKAAA